MIEIELALVDTKTETNSSQVILKTRTRDIAATTRALVLASIPLVNIHLPKTRIKVDTIVAAAVGIRINIIAAVIRIGTEIRIDIHPPNISHRLHLQEIKIATEALIQALITRREVETTAEIDINRKNLRSKYKCINSLMYD